MTTTTEDTDELSKHRRIAQTAKLAASLATEGARLYDELRKDGLSPTSAMAEIAKHVPALHRSRDMSKGQSMAYLGFSLESIRVGLDDTLSPEEKFARLKAMIETEPALCDIKLTVTNSDGKIVDEVLRVPFEFTPLPPMKATISRLFSEAGSPLDDQAPALECWILLHGLPTTIHGSLSETPEGELRMLSPAPAPPNSRSGSVMMVEQFFCYSDVLSIAVQRAVDVVLDEPRIIRS